MRSRTAFDCLRLLLALTCAASLTACGGGGGGSGGAPSEGGITPVTPAALSSDQQIFESVNLAGGDFDLTWNLPYGGGNLVSGTHFFYATSHGVLAASPATAGPQIQIASNTSLDSALAIPKPVSTTRYLLGGAIQLAPPDIIRRVSYTGSTVKVDYLAGDQTTVLASAQFSGYQSTALSGPIGNSPEAFLAAYPVENWINANNFAANARWQAGSAYVSYRGQRSGDTLIVEDCTRNGIDTPTSGANPTPCASEAGLSSIFPVTLFTASKPYETDEAAAGTFTSLQGLPIWIANQPLPQVQDYTVAYRVYFQLNGNLYMGLLEKDGAAFVYGQADGTVEPYTTTLNQAAIASLQAGLITGATLPGSQAGSTAETGSTDLFGIGGHGVNGALAPADLVQHYAIPSQWTGAGQTIAIINAPATGDFADDLNVFSQYYGLPQCNAANPCLQHIDLSNGAAVSPANDSASEVALDLQAAHAVAPGATLILVTAASGSFSDMLAAISYAAALPGVSVVSMSYSYYSLDPLTSTTADATLNALQTSLGTVIVASSGDNGYYPASGSYPAASYAVTAVGGTRITTLPASTTAPGEVAWPYSGGQRNPYDTMPSWQTPVVGAGLLNATGGYRIYPDVAANADFQHSAFAVYRAQHWVMEGGTSLSAPVWAGITALFGQYLAGKGTSLQTLVKSTPGGFNGLLYASRVAQGSTGGFFDITSGGNGLVYGGCPAPQCTAGTGFDGVTGLGSPNVAALFSNF